MRVTLADINEIEPAMLDKFIVNISGFSEFAGGDTRLSSIRASAIDVPHVNTTAEGVFGFGTKEYFPNYTDVDSFSISFIEDANYSITRALKAWKLRVVDANGFYGMPSQYKRTVSLTPVAPLASNYPMPRIGTDIPDVPLKIDVGRHTGEQPSMLDNILRLGQPPNHAGTPYEVTVPGVSGRSHIPTIQDGVQYTPPKFSLVGCFPTATDAFSYEQSGSILIVKQAFSVDNGTIA